MYIRFVEIQNFRKLRAVRLDLHSKRTLLVGANNSGKTSALQCLSHFLVNPKAFSTNDFTLSNWAQVNEIGRKWMDPASPPSFDLNDWKDVLPSVDVWLEIGDNEIHHVRHLVPTLEWEGGLLGVRLRYEPRNTEGLHREYHQAVTAVRQVKQEAFAKHGKETTIALWPDSLRDFLDRRLRSLFVVRAYTLDPSRCKPPTKSHANPQELPTGSEPLDGDEDVFSGLIRIDEISAQRGFGAASRDSADEAKGRRVHGDQRRLSEQLRSYYADHLDPTELPEASDLAALEAIEQAQRLFDTKLKDGFKSALEEIQGLGYPGISDPKLTIGTKLRPADALNHDTAVRYEVSAESGEISASPLLLPEEYNGLGYQNLISMVFRLMSFRDAWMQVGKAAKKAAMTDQESIAPLHLVLIEEPEAHLHAQVQQVFIRKAYEILRKHSDLGESQVLRTQLVVSTHSSHVSHECEFACLRYFRRLPASSKSEVPVSKVVNLSEAFGPNDETQRFVTRYLTAGHSDLFFADAAILVEGSAERMLLPHFIRSRFENLNQRYLSLLEIGGSHAHRLRPLIEHLGLTTLIITDLDPTDPNGGKAVPTARAANLVTGNATLRLWHPQKVPIDDLLDLPETAKEKSDDDLFSVRVAYQGPVNVSLKEGSGPSETLPTTFEDALVFENVAAFRSLEGDGMTRKIRDAVVAHESPQALAHALFTIIRGGIKAAFALDLLFSKEPSVLTVPRYIADGLEWLEKQLARRDVDLLPVSTESVDAG